ncbi:MAG: amidohydrolase family protein [Chloroflexi bacterium]|nr:amidohydrolase family protein [Chloroflexota bacterium]
MVTALKGGILVDGTGSDPIAPAVLLIEGQRIVGLGKDGEVAVPSDAQVIDVAGKTLLPGLINCHTHLSWDGLHDLKTQSHWDSPMVAMAKATMNLRQCLQAGVTTIREVGVPYGIDAALVEAIQENILVGPRLIHSGIALVQTGGHCYWQPNYEVNGPDEVRKAVREQLKIGADWIKVMASGSRREGLTRVGTASNKELPEFTRAELAAAADEAHEADKKITAHAVEARAVRNCLAAGFDCLEHTPPFDGEMLETAIRNGVWVVPTLSANYLAVERGAELGMPTFEIEERRLRITSGRRVEPLLRAARAGVKMAMGTDAGSWAVPHNAVAREVELLYDVGVCKTRMDAIVMSTRNGAELLDLGTEVGTLAVGKLADVLVVDGNPLASLAALWQVHLVFLGGRLMVRDGVVLY